MVPLHNHSHYSALDGLAKPEDIAKRCQDLDFHSCCVTDHDVVAGHVDFYKTMKDNNIKPLLGIETYQTPGKRQTNFGNRRDKEGNKTDNFHLILIAQNNTGLRNLWALNSEAHLTGFYHNARVDWDLLSQFSEGIICTSACGLSMLNQAIQNNPNAGDAETLIDNYLAIFGDRFYIELSTYSGEWVENYNTEAVRLARERGIPLVYANDAHYAFPEQYDLHEMVLCMQPQHRQKWADHTEPFHSPDLYIMSESEVEQRLSYLPNSVIMEAIESSEDIAAMSNVTLPEFKQHTPMFVPDKEYGNSREMFVDLAIKGYEKRIAAYNKPDEEYMPRFEYEIETILNANLQDYFLIVRDYIMAAKKQGIMVGPGRGSVGGSLLAFLIGVTEVDPIRYDLLFERFYNAGRADKLPDIDTDFTVAGRPWVKNYIAKKYGEPYVAEIGAVSEMQGKGAIVKLGSLFGIPRNDVSKISAIIEKSIESGQQPKWEKIYENGGDELQVFVKKYPELFDCAEKLFKHIFTYTVHPSGVLVTDGDPIAEVFPLRYHPKEKKMVTQWDMRTAEMFGYMKMDVLGLRNLDTLDEVNKILKGQGKTPIDYEAIQYQDHPEEMWKFLDEGKTVGIFQIEDGGGAKKLCKQIAPRNIEELALITALNRPGPLKSGAAERFIKKRNDPLWNENRGERLETIADRMCSQAAHETYGEFVYQEQIIRLFTLLGYDPKEADNVRDILGKKKRDKMAEAKQVYEQRANKAGWLAHEILDIWHGIEQFADYAFNKAHSVEYGLIALDCLYAKFHYPAQFIMAGMRTVDKKHQHRYINEAKRMNIDILPPDINKSDVETTIDGTSIRYGLSNIKWMGKVPAKWIIANRPFNSYEEILERAQQPELKITLPSGIKKVAIDSRQVENLKKLATYTGTELLELEEELLGLSISDNSARILEDYSKEIEEECVGLEFVDEEGEWTVAGVIKEIRHAKTKAGKPMAWVTIENGDIERTFTVWNNELQRLKFIWRRRTAVIARVATNDRGSTLKAAKILYSKNGR
jgi:DNA polymerase-3 subunit alpha